MAGVLRSRRTIHLFTPAVPPRALVMQALDLARWAPNHRMTEPWRFYLLGPETAGAIAQLNAEIVVAARGEAAGQKKLDRWQRVPGWLVVTCARSEDPVRQHEDLLACACAVQNFQLALWAEGVGTKWSTGKVTRDPRFFELLGIDPAEEVFVAMLWYGYPAEIPEAQRRPVAEVLVERE